MSRDGHGMVYNVLYALALGMLCAGVLTGASEFLRPYREANEKADEIRDVLGILGVAYEPDATSQDLIALFERNVEEQKRGDLQLFVQPGAAGRPEAIAVRFSGKGLWGPVWGWLALAPDLRTIRGIAFQAPDETPLFGGEIVKPYFCDRFKGKSIYGPSGEPGFRVTQGEGDTAVNEVHAITGATLTSDKVQQILDALAKRIARETATRGD